MENHHLNIVVFGIVSSTGRMAYSAVRIFLKKDSLTIVKYQSITTSCNESLTLSEDHLLYARKVGSEEFHPM